MSELEQVGVPHPAVHRAAVMSLAHVRTKICHNTNQYIFSSHLIWDRTYGLAVKSDLPIYAIACKSLRDWSGPGFDSR